jgi:hypothetical protein
MPFVIKVGGIDAGNEVVLAQDRGDSAVEVRGRAELASDSGELLDEPHGGCGVSEASRGGGCQVAPSGGDERCAIGAAALPAAAIDPFGGAIGARLGRASHGAAAHGGDAGASVGGIQGRASS